MPSELEEFLASVAANQNLSKQQKSGISFRARKNSRLNNNDLAIRGLQRRNLRKTSAIDQLLGREQVSTLRQARDLNQRSTDLDSRKLSLEEMIGRANIRSIDSDISNSGLANLLAKSQLDLNERKVRGNLNLREREREDDRKLGLLDSIINFRKVEVDSALERILQENQGLNKPKSAAPRQDPLRNLFLALLGSF